MKLTTDLLEKDQQTSFIKPEGGFFLTLPLRKQGIEEEDIACRLFETARILVHPGYFYDMEGSHLVLSFVSRPGVLRSALKTVIEQIR